jgi:hypothetical protein
MSLVDTTVCAGKDIVWLAPTVVVSVIPGAVEVTVIVEAGIRDVVLPLDPLSWAAVAGLLVRNPTRFRELRSRSLPVPVIDAL